MPIRAVALLLSLLSGIAAVAHGAQVDGLYEADVPVSGQSAAERQVAITEGLRQVLVKASGQRSVLSLPGIAGELKTASTLLSSWRYEAVPAQPGNGTAAAPLRLRLNFDGRGVRAILNRAGAPVWSGSRPVVFLSVGRQAGTVREPFVPGTRQADILLAAAGERGLPVALSAAAEALPAAVTPAVLDEARRLGARGVLAASLSGTGNRWLAAGQLVFDGQQEPIEGRGITEAGALQELVFVAADRLGARLAVVASADALQSVRVDVTGIGNLSGHAQLARWLRGLPLVRDLQVQALAGERVSYDLVVAGDPEVLRGLVADDGRLLDVRLLPGPVPRIEARLPEAPGP